jgi:hypothetical protein
LAQPAGMVESKAAIATAATPVMELRIMAALT